MKVNHPAIITVPAPPVPPGASDLECAAIEDFAAVAALVMFLERHGGCGGWGYDPATGTLACQCGGLTYEIGPAEARTGAAA